MNFKFHAIGTTDASIPENAAAGVHGFQGTALHASVRFQTKLSGVDTVYEAMNAEEDFRL